MNRTIAMVLLAVSALAINEVTNAASSAFASRYVPAKIRKRTCTIAPQEFEAPQGRSTLGPEILDHLKKKGYQIHGEVTTDPDLTLEPQVRCHSWLVARQCVARLKIRDIAFEKELAAVEGDIQFSVDEDPIEFESVLPRLPDCTTS